MKGVSGEARGRGGERRARPDCDDTGCGGQGRHSEAPICRTGEDPEGLVS